MHELTILLLFNEGIKCGTQSQATGAVKTMHKYDQHVWVALLIVLLREV